MSERSELDAYRSAASVETAIKEAAKKAALQNQSKTVSEYIRLAYFDRLLCRIFSVGDKSQWILKGGNGMLARLADARRTTDLDLFTDELTTDEAKSELTRLASIDLGDYFSFRYIREEVNKNSQAQSNVEVMKIFFEVYIGAQSKQQPIKIDVAVGKVAPNRVDILKPVSRLELPKLVSFDYRLWSIENQIADKVCATLQSYVGGKSTRSKDLFDLLVIAQTQTVGSSSLAQALSTEAAGRNIELGTKFNFPNNWWNLISSEHRNSKYLKSFVDVESVSDHLNRLIFGCELEAEQTWNPEVLNWQSPAR
jgi:hypothetical protein